MHQNNFVLEYIIQMYLIKIVFEQCFILHMY